MTIIIGITTPDGVILARDSRTPEGHDGGHRIISDSAQKVFEVGRFGVATTGLAFLAGKTIAGLMDQFPSSTRRRRPKRGQGVLGRSRNILRRSIRRMDSC